MDIEKFCLNNNLGTVINIKKITGGLMHKMFKVETNKGIYAIKVLNKEVISRKEAYDNFVVSEKISNFVKENRISVSNAILLNNNFINQFCENYYMVFNFIEGKTLIDKEITIEHCKKIGSILADIHNLNYKSLKLDETIRKDNFYVEWSDYLNHDNFNSMSYAILYKENYHKYYSILKRVLERFNESNKELSICHKDMDPKNVMWKNNEPIIIDWESATLGNPNRELIEVALTWSGFLSNDFNLEKYKAILLEYTKKRTINGGRYITICGNLIGRFGWLDYNLKRSLGIKSNDIEEKKLAENEVTKTINEINRYLELIGIMYNTLCQITKKQNTFYNKDIETIISKNNILKNKNYTLITKGFTNTIYQIDDYIIRICTNLNNEERFKNEISFYNQNKNNPNIPKLYVADTSKKNIPYYYEVIEKIEGKTLYEIWYKLSIIERKEIILKIIKILKSIHNIEVQPYDFNQYIKDKLIQLINECNIKDDKIYNLLNLCNKYFKENKFGIIHGDLHFDNFIYDNGILKLIDFERNMVAPIDYDFYIFNKYKETPWLWASEETDLLTVEDDYQDIMNIFIENYKELKSISYLKERLIIYDIIKNLENFKKTKDYRIIKRIKEKIEKNL